MRAYKWLSLISLSVMISCGKSLPTLDGVDGKAWKNDRNGCGSHRAPMKDAIIASKDKLLALSELQIVELLGRPDRNELSSRNQKFYYYFLEPAPECGASLKTGAKLTIRFNAMGLAKEVLVQ